MGLHLQRTGSGYDDTGVVRFYGGLVWSKNILVRLIWILVEHRLASALIREDSLDVVNGWPSRDSQSILWML